MSQGEVPAELQSAWEAILGRRGQLSVDPMLADLALGLIAEMGNEPAHRDVLYELAGTWTQDGPLTLVSASLLVEQAARRGMDEPPLADDGPAQRAAAALEKSLQSLTDRDGRDPDVAGRLYVTLGNALRLMGPARDAEAQAAFGQAIELDRGRGQWWFDAALLHKWRGRFAEAYDANEEARERLGPTRAVLWNLAVCATALGKGERAVELWEALGVPATLDGAQGMPYVEGLPPLLVRVLSRTPGTDATSELPDKAVGFELVWVAPLSPCHGVVQSPTFRDAPIDYGDLVLWDGAPVATHQTAGGDQVPVFPLLEILKPGDEHRWPFVGLQREPGSLEGLEGSLPAGARVFIQHERVAHHCPACAAGEPHTHEAGSGSGSGSASGPASVPASVSASASAPVPASVSHLVRGKLIVPAGIDLEALRTAWEAALGARAVSIAVPSLYEALGETKRAGQEHQAWRGIERKALRQEADA